jgi:hypothetical protein
MRSSCLVLAIAVVVAAAGCGGSPQGTSAKTAGLGKPFRSRALAVCRTALAQKQALGPFPFPTFNPTRPDVSKLAPIGRLEARTVKIYKAWLHDMRALGEPPTGRAEWAAVVSALARNGAIIADQQRAAARREPSTFTEDYYSGNRAQQEFERASDAAGLPGCQAAAAV